MNRQILTFVFFVLLIASCTTTKSSTKKCYRNTKTIVSGYWMGKMTDHYFKLKKYNYFQYYERIMGLTKMKEYNGTYTLSNDTLNLIFCNDNIPYGLIGLGYIDNKNKKIVLLGTNGSNDQHYPIRVDKR